MAVPQVPTDSQRKAIESDVDCLLVLAGPGSGKTFCLIERIRFLIEEKGVDPGRICAFTFTNKASEEIAERLTGLSENSGQLVTKGTLHSFCVKLLREFPEASGVTPGFGIADDQYREVVLRRAGVIAKYRGSTLKRFSAFKNCQTEFIHSGDQRSFEKYSAYLASRNVLDFDDLVVKAGDLLETAQGDEIRARWDVLLVDEFQDLNPQQYRLVQLLVREHLHIFAVGDYEQSIYGWAGATPDIFTRFANDYGLTQAIHLDENHRCPEDILRFARELIQQNPLILGERTRQKGTSDPGEIDCRSFPTEAEEFAWLISDVKRVLNEKGAGLEDLAVLYREHRIGNRLEPEFINAGIPSRLARSRAMGDDPAIEYLVSALGIIRNPDDEVLESRYFERVIKPTVLDRARATMRHTGLITRGMLQTFASTLAAEDAVRKEVRRALADHRNLKAVGKQSYSVADLVNVLLTKRVGIAKTILEERAPELSDPAEWDEVVAVARHIDRARSENRPVWLEEAGGVAGGVGGLLRGIGITQIEVSDSLGHGATALRESDCRVLGLPLTVFKAAQLLEMQSVSPTELSFTAVDTETSDFTPDKEIIDIGAVRVREGRIVEEFSALVKPERAISTEATRKHGITKEMVADSPPFKDVWPAFRRFCGSDVIVAHNGYAFDFPLMTRQAQRIGEEFDLCCFDTLPMTRDLFPTSARLEDLAAQFGIEYGHHRGLADSICLARVYLRLEEENAKRARKTACLNLLQHLGIALALSDEATLCDEAKMFREMCTVYVLGRYSHGLDAYAEWSLRRTGVATVGEIIDQLGGRERMEQIRADKTAEDRYPAAISRLKILLSALETNTFDRQLTELLDKIALSKQDEGETASDRVSLLTLHATKGLEFPVVYVVGVETASFPGGRTRPPEAAEIEESRRLLYVGMTRAQKRLVMTCVDRRDDKDGCGHLFLDEMGVIPTRPK